MQSLGRPSYDVGLHVRMRRIIRKEVLSFLSPWNDNTDSCVQDALMDPSCYYFRDAECTYEGTETYTIPNSNSDEQCRVRSFNVNDFKQ